MSDVSMPGSKLRVGSLGDLPVFLAWLVIALILPSALFMAGRFPNGDVDDLLKAHEVRFLLESGNIFDRTLPGILQPEPFVSHWPWLVGCRYAAVAFILRPIVGLRPRCRRILRRSAAAARRGSFSSCARLVGTFGFANPALVFVVSAVVALRALAEFEPGRIDYHNIQMLLLVANRLAHDPARRPRRLRQRCAGGTCADDRRRTRPVPGAGLRHPGLRFHIRWA